MHGSAVRGIFFWFEVFLWCYPDNGVKLSATRQDMARGGLIMAWQERRKLREGRKDTIKSGGGAN